jgi:hypothetical protein
VNVTTVSRLSEYGNRFVMQMYVPGCAAVDVHVILVNPHPYSVVGGVTGIYGHPSWWLYKCVWGPHY